MKSGWRSRRFATPDFDQVGVTVGGEQSFMQTFLVDLKVLMLILTTDRAGHPIRLMLSVSNEGFQWGKIMQI